MSGCDGTLPPIMADPDLLKIVFVNLLVNGAHAMHGRGTIRVSLVTMATPVRLRSRTRGLVFRRMSGKRSPPFFTTKAGDRAWVCQRSSASSRLIRLIAIACPTGGGTIVTIELPASDPPSACRKRLLAFPATWTRLVCGVSVRGNNPHLTVDCPVSAGWSHANLSPYA